MEKSYQINFYLAVILMISVLSSCSQDEPRIEPPEIWGQLEQGPYQIGFRTLFNYDASRPPIPHSDWDGRLVSTSETKGRQMQINIWYPAKVTSKDKKLKFGHYVNLFGRQTEFADLDETKIAFANQELINKINSLGGNGRFTEASLDSLKVLETHAFLESKAILGEFPVVIFPNGTSPAFQSIMCEFLASYGFVVGAVGLKGMHAYTEEISSKGIEMAVVDLNTTIQILLTLPQVNRNKIGIIGNAITSSQAVAYQNRNSNVDCIISLDGGLISAFEQRLLQETPFYSDQSVNVPILAIYAPHPAIDPLYIDNLRYSDRYFLHFPQMSEFHFLNFGQFDRFIPNIIGEHIGEVQKGHELACLYSLKFLKAFLTDDLESKMFLEKRVPETYNEHIDTAFIKKALPKTPEITSLKNAYYDIGFQYIDSIYWVYKKTDPTPFSETFYADMKDWLAWKKDPEYNARYELYKLAYDSYPNSANVNYYLGYFALETGNLEDAIFHLGKALKIIEQDNDETISVERKKRLNESLLELLTEARNNRASRLD